VLVHLLLEGVEGAGLVDVFGVVRHRAVEFGVGELDDTLAQVAQVLEQVVVVGVDEFPARR
jgi:hypothetical protein